MLLRSSIFPPPPADPTQMAGWVRDGLADQTSVSILYHAQHTFRRGDPIDDCPFSAECPQARERWLWMFDAAATAARAAHEIQRAAIGDLLDDPIEGRDQ